MARAIFAVFALAVSWSSSVQAQDAPIRATIGDQGAMIRGGPDENHYATSELTAGTEVEIHRLDPGGWCAIRPTAECFSLVRADALTWIDQDGGIAEIIEDGEPCWVGTRMGQVDEPMWQVNLSRGERVQVLGAIESDDDPAVAAWYQIAPPNGEFRWIAWSDLDQTSQQLVLQQFDSAPSALQALDSGSDTATKRTQPHSILERDNNYQPAPIAVVEPEPTQSLNEQRGEIALAGFDEQDAVRQNRPAPSSEGQWRAPQHRRSTNRGPAYSTAMNNQPGTSFQSPDPTRRMDATPASATMSPNSSPPPQRWPAALQALDIRLSSEILKEPTQWQLDGLAHDVRQFKQTCSPSDAAIADHILNKIQQFQWIKTGTPPTSVAGNSGGVQGIVAVVGQEAIPLSRSDGSSSAVAGMDYSKTYDAYGWLNELVRDEGMGQTTFVLQDDQGKITHLVAATPGLNLHRYLKTKIGIVGQKGYHQQMKLDHVTAERVVSLETVRR